MLFCFYALLFYFIEVIGALVVKNHFHSFKLEKIFFVNENDS